MPNLVEVNYGRKVIGNHAARGAMSADQLVSVALFEKKPRSFWSDFSMAEIRQEADPSA